MKTFQLLPISAVLVCACSSNDLPRRKAAELISRQQNLPTTQTVRVFERYLKRSWSKPVVGFGVVTLCNYEGQKYADVEQQLADWQSRGVVSMGESSDDGACPALWATVSLTDEGRKYVVRETSGAHEVKVYELSFGEITGVQINEQFKAAEADYTLKKVNVTPFGSAFSIDPGTGRATFALFDDGWRITNNSVSAGLRARAASPQDAEQRRLRAERETEQEHLRSEREAEQQRLLAEEQRLAEQRAGEERQKQLRAVSQALESPDCNETEQSVPARSDLVFVVPTIRECWTQWLVVEGNPSMSIHESANILLQFKFQDGSVRAAFEDGPKMRFTTPSNVRAIRFRSLRREPVTITLSLK